MNKNIKILIAGIVVLFAIYLIYGISSSTSEAIGTFDKFDVNSTASKDIKVEIVHEKGVTTNPEGGMMFFVKDKNGDVKKVTLDMELPQLNNDHRFITLRGHLHGDYFHATSAELD
ncbi:MAG: hypothetical protein JNK43_03855 [Ignavibacteria bacterium]|nr:hypothetical protein [Ignavibacteria bacterium]